MSVPPLIQYPLDLDGTSLTNKVQGERREITIDTARAFVPKAGPFYTDSFVITNVATGKPLVPIDDYVLAQPFSQASMRSGKDVQCAVVLKLKAPITVEYSYQVVGGEYSWNLTALAELIAGIGAGGGLNDRQVQWGSILGRPTAYPPAPHIHDIGDSYGWEYVVWQLERITQAILIGDEASHDEIRQQIKLLGDKIELSIGSTADDLKAHLNDKNNPHGTNKAHVGLSQVEDYPPATAGEALAGEATNRYLTPATAMVMINKFAQDLLNAHISDKNNPHGVTKSQVGLDKVDNFPTATKAQAESGTEPSAFMTPATTRAAIMTLAGDLISKHISDKNNPHGTTKAQVGLDLVENYKPANTDEAIAGVFTDRYMTPFVTKAAIEELAGNLLRTHVQNFENPHGVTKGQVGLSNIPNDITRARTLNSDAHLLTAGAMADHVVSADHDDRYVRLNVQTNTSMRVVGNTLQVYVSGQWRQVWPATWTNFAAPGAGDPSIGTDGQVTFLNAGGKLYASVHDVWQQVWPATWND